MAKARAAKPLSTEATPLRSRFAKAANEAGLDAKAGKSAVKSAYQSGISVRDGYKHTESVDIDAHFASSEPREPRWDYGLGIASASGAEIAFWVEPHSASSSREVDRMIRKLQWLKVKLELEEFADLRALRDAALRHATLPYRWLAQTGDICISPNSKEARLLALHGLDQPRRFIRLP